MQRAKGARQMGAVFLMCAIFESRWRVFPQPGCWSAEPGVRSCVLHLARRRYAKLIRTPVTHQNARTDYLFERDTA